jgi:hypothetical protein
VLRGGDRSCSVAEIGGSLGRCTLIRCPFGIDAYTD